jgi:hypothetical protein
MSATQRADVATDQWPDSQSLPAHARVLLRYAGPRLIAAFFVAAVALRVAIGGLSWRDAVGPTVILAVEPFVEWMIHVFLLHFRPKTIRGRVVDPLVARKHREHHIDPRDVELVLVPTRVVAIVLPVAALIVAAVGRTAAGVTTLAAAYGMLLTYEWTHFLIHSKYRPRHAYYRLIWRHHRNHHFRNEHYWFGVTVDLGDRVLRTAPARDAVPVSPTAKNLAAGWD